MLLLLPYHLCITCILILNTHKAKILLKYKQNVYIVVFDMTASWTAAFWMLLRWLLLIMLQQKF